LIYTIQIFTIVGNSEQYFKTNFSPKPISIESIHLIYPITFMWLWNLDTGI